MRHQVGPVVRRRIIHRGSDNLEILRPVTICEQIKPVAVMLQ